MSSLRGEDRNRRGLRLESLIQLYQEEETQQRSKSHVAEEGTQGKR